MAPKREDPASKVLTTSVTPQVECPRCGYENRPGARFCGECATALANVTCSRCGAVVLQGQKFCDACGQRVDQRRSSSGLRRRAVPPGHLADRMLAEQAALEARGSRTGERKTITALFADIKGSVELIQDLDPEEAAHLIDPAIELMIDAVHEFDGYVDKCTGDGILALFGAPLAQEDHAQRAVFAALRIQEEIARYADKLRRDDRPRVELRVGLNSGEVVLRSIRKDDLRADYSPIGHATNLAARMEGLATPGGILVSESTYQLAEGFVEFRPIGPVSVKGVRDQVRTYAVVGVGTLRTRLERAARRGLSPFTGRDAEHRQLQSALDHALAGHGQVVALVGEPGIGKSRLFREFMTDARVECLVLEAGGVSHGRSSPYLPVIAMLRDYFHIVAADEEGARRRKVADLVAALDPALEDTLPYLYHLLGVAELSSPIRQMDARIRRRRTFEALKRLLFRESLRQPLVLALEDLQWVDGETQAMLDILVEGVGSARVLLLVNYRPEYQHGWGSKTYYTQLPLEALAREDGDQMVSALLGEDPDLDQVKRLILEKSEGNPFFIEEIVQALFDRTALVRTPDGVALSSPLTTIQIPATVQGVLAARIDRLPDRERKVLQTLAVIGRAFSLDLAEQVVDASHDELQTALAALQDAEFMYEQPTLAGSQYTFKHALTQMVAYGSLLAERRWALHERVAQAIETLYPTRLEDHCGELVHHFRHSGNTSKAVAYLRLAAQQAVQRSAHKEAVEHLTMAQNLLVALPEGPDRIEQELAIQVALGAPLALTKGYAAPEVGRARVRAQELCQRIGETPQLFPVLFGLWAFNLVRGELRTARELGTRLLGLAESARDSALLLEAHRAMGATLFFVGELAQAHQHLEEGIRLYDAHVHGDHAFLFGQDPGVSCLSYEAIVLWHLGHPDAAERTAHNALELASRIAHPFSMAFALDMAAAVHQFRRHAGRTLELAEHAVALSAEQGFPLWSAYGSLLRGWALVYHRKREANTANLHEALMAWRATGAQVCGPYLLGMIAEAYAEIDEPATGLPLVVEGLRRVDSTGERFWEPELLRLQGRLLDASSVPPTPEAEPCLRAAVATARDRGARGLELRAATSLSAWLAGQGKASEARAELLEPYNSFTEGFDTVDLREARRLLADLSG
jgi:class 3 adenylate cyclase/predicted ATPase